MNTPHPRPVEPARSRRRAQRGAALIVSLLLLAIVMLLATAGWQMGSQEERMVGQQRDRAIAFEAAEATLRDAERDLLGSCASGIAAGACSPRAALINGETGFGAAGAENTCSADGLCLGSTAERPDFSSRMPIMVLTGAPGAVGAGPVGTRGRWRAHTAAARLGADVHRHRSLAAARRLPSVHHRRPELRDAWVHRSRDGRADDADVAHARPGRIDRKIKVHRPTKEGAREIYRIYLAADLPFDPALVAKPAGPVSDHRSCETCSSESNRSRLSCARLNVCRATWPAWVIRPLTVWLRAMVATLRGLSADRSALLLPVVS